MLRALGVGVCEECHSVVSLTARNRTWTRASLTACWCCGGLERSDGYCYLCDGPDGTLVSPPHVCERSDRAFTDEHGCAPEGPFH